SLSLRFAIAVPPIANLPIALPHSDSARRIPRRTYRHSRRRKSSWQPAGNLGKQGDRREERGWAQARREGLTPPENSAAWIQDPALPGGAPRPPGEGGKAQSRRRSTRAASTRHAAPNAASTTTSAAAGIA